MSPRTRPARFALAAMMVSSAADAQPRRSAPRRARACIPGAQHPCACGGGGRGVQVCNDEGSGLGRCDCPSIAPSRPAVRALSAAHHGPAFDPVAVRGRRRWDGWQTLLVDAGSIAVTAIGLSTANETVYWIGGGMQILGGPIVHWSHGHVGTGFADLGLRILLPLTGALIAWAPNQSATALTIGAAVGQVAAIIIDASALAFETDTNGGRAEASPTTAPRWSLGVTPLSQGALMGVGLQL